MPGTLVLGTPAKIYSAVAAAAPQSAFSIQPKQAGGGFSVVFEGVGTATSLTATLEISLDGGTTWATFRTAANFFNAVSAATAALVTPMVSGALYRINPSILTGSQDFWACAN